MSALHRAPFVFSKRPSGEWELLPEWRDEDDESATLFAAYQRGPAGASRPVQRFRVVTFHPSFSYEDFIRGIRPVVTSEEGATQFRVVDGVFKRIADEARANPTKRYALFIDEISQHCQGLRRVDHADRGRQTDNDWLGRQRPVGNGSGPAGEPGR